MEGEKRLMGTLLHLTLEIIHLLTGQDYVVVRKSDEKPISGGRRRTRSPTKLPPSHPLILETITKQKIQELTDQITKLLTGEVPIRCQDVAVYLSMEEWRYLEGHKEDYKEAMMEDYKEAMMEDYKEAMMEDYKEAMMEDYKEAMKEDYKDAMMEDYKEAMKENYKDAMKGDHKDAMMEDYKEAMKENYKDTMKEDHKDAMMEDYKDAMKEAIKEDYKEVMMEDSPSLTSWDESDTTCPAGVPPQHPPDSTFPAGVPPQHLPDAICPAGVPPQHPPDAICPAGVSPQHPPDATFPAGVPPQHLPDAMFQKEEKTEAETPDNGRVHSRQEGDLSQLRACRNLPLCTASDVKVEPHSHLALITPDTPSQEETAASYPDGSLQNSDLRAPADFRQHVCIGAKEEPRFSADRDPTYDTRGSSSPSNEELESWHQIIVMDIKEEPCLHEDEESHSLPPNTQAVFPDIKEKPRWQKGEELPRTVTEFNNDAAGNGHVVDSSICSLLEHTRGKYLLACPVGGASSETGDNRREVKDPGYRGHISYNTQLAGDGYMVRTYMADTEYSLTCPVGGASSETGDNRREGKVTGYGNHISSNDNTQPAAEWDITANHTDVTMSRRGPPPPGDKRRHTQHLKGSRGNTSSARTRKKPKPDQLIHSQLQDQPSLDNFICSKCDKSFAERSLLLLHRKSHMRKKSFRCSDCGKSFSKHVHYIRHQSVHTGVKPYACPECGKSFSDYSYLNKHQRRHTDAVTQAFGCPECGLSFTTQYELVAHCKTHNGTKPFECSECGKSFTRNYQLIKHRKMHSGDEPFQCLECGRCFRNDVLLDRHLQYHAKEKHFTCSECTKSFSNRSHYVRHLRTHTGEKPFMCSECGRCFSDKSSLYRHNRLHTGEKPYICPDCGQTYSCSSTLNKHQQTHATNRLYKCPECEAFFISKPELLTHCRVHTTEK